MKKFFASLILLLIIASCQSQTEINPEVGLLNEIKLNDLIKKNNGRVLVVNVWATWCVPCVEEMPDLVKLAKTYESDKVQIIGISIDYPEEIDSKILPFIKENKMNFTVYVNDFKNDEALINFLNPDWSGAIPATIVYDKKGNQKEFLLGKHEFDEFKTAVQKYL